MSRSSGASPGTSHTRIQAYIPLNRVRTVFTVGGMSVFHSGTLSWKIIPCAQHGHRQQIPRHQYDHLRCELTSSVLVGYVVNDGQRRGTESPAVYLLVASMGEVRRLNRCTIAIETAPTNGFPSPQNEYVVLTAANEQEGSAWLNALCDAVEGHKRDGSIPAPPPLRPPRSYTVDHKYAPAPADRTPKTPALHDMSSPFRPPPVPRRTSVRFADPQRLAHEDVSQEWPNKRDASRSDSGEGDVSSSSDWRDGDPQPSPHSPPQAQQTTGWRATPKPLLTDIVHNGVYPPRAVLAPASDSLVTASPVESDVPVRQPEKRSSRASRTPLRQAPTPVETERSPRRQSHPRSTRHESLPEEEPADPPEPRLSGQNTRTSSLSLPLSQWRWGPVEPGPAVPAVVAMVGGSDARPLLADNNISTAVLGTCVAPRRAITPLIQYAASSARRFSSRSPDREQSKVGASPSRWRTDVTDPRSRALMPLSAAALTHTCRTWSDEPKRTTREGTRGASRNERGATSRRSHSRSHRQRKGAEDSDDDDVRYYSSHKHKKRSQRQHDIVSTPRSEQKRPPIDDEDVAYLCEPRLLLKYDAQASSGRSPALHYFFLTVDEQYLVAVPAGVFESAIKKAGIGKDERHSSRHSRSHSKRASVPRAPPKVAVRSLDRAIEFFGNSCTALSLRSILRVRRGFDEPMVMDNPVDAARFVDKACLVCVISNKRAFFLESQSEEEASNVVFALEAILSESLPR